MIYLPKVYGTCMGAYKAVNTALSINKDNVLFLGRRTFFMLEFKTIEEHKPNPKLLELIKGLTYKIKKGKVKVLLNTNLQFIEPTKYLITYPITLTILEYKVNEISSKNFYIKENNQKYNLKEIKQILIKLSN